jgi:hypothetical protein
MTNAYKGMSFTPLIFGGACTGEGTTPKNALISVSQSTTTLYRWKSLSPSEFSPRLPAQDAELIRSLLQEIVHLTHTGLHRMHGLGGFFDLS